MEIYNENELRKVVEESKTFRQILLRFGRNESSASYNTLKRYLKKFNISTNHFLTRSENTKNMYSTGKLVKKETIELFTKNNNIGRSIIKKRIIDEKLIEYECCICGNKGEWFDKKITLILDHINGVNNDNRLENLRFLCPNCNATLETHCVGSKVFNKEVKIDKRSNRKIRLETRKVEWPTQDELISLLEHMSYSAIGRKYNVSDTTIRKWAKFYGII